MPKYIPPTNPKLDLDEKVLMFTLLAEIEEMKARRSALRAQTFALIAQRVDSNDPKVRDIACEITVINDKLAKMDANEVMRKFEVSQNYAHSYTTRYLNGQSIHGRKRYRNGRKFGDVTAQAESTGRSA